MTPRLVTQRKAAELAGWSVRTIQKHRKAGRLVAKGMTYLSVPTGQGGARYVALPLFDPADVMRIRTESARSKHRARKGFGQRQAAHNKARQKQRMAAILKAFYSIPKAERAGIGRGWVKVALAKYNENPLAYRPTRRKERTTDVV